MSTGCAKAAEQVYFYLDDEIGWFRRWQVKRHLRKCRNCCDRFEFEERLKELVAQNADTPEESGELISRLQAFLREQGPGDSE